MGRAHSPFVVLIAVVASVAAGCARHVRLESPDTSAGARYTCTGKAPCEPATSDVPSQLNPSGTTFVTLPRQCRGRIHRIVISDADSNEPKVDVTCAPEDEPIGDME